MESTKQCFELQEMGDVVIVTSTNSRIMEDFWIQDAERELFRLVDGEGRAKILIDLHNVEFMSAAFLGKLMTLDKKTKARGGKLVFCRVCETICEIFSITRLDKLFCIVPSVEDGIRTLNGIL